ncbi:hypothetical protein P872_12140 [Rhodonellum psychrophilum GCM71 = DSM 17998]|uniref:Uncharacterized protein n=1 Tax=Rhodonellum psychrophilum GCM71 = DSM 17998 TaxID=1123057 RepID=U5BYG5_9BACT|nr:hypothetical protein P872_12140 [Rhodonellum psychrophilum GCM71 = DSM 17998]
MGLKLQENLTFWKIALFADRVKSKIARNSLISFLISGCYKIVDAYLGFNQF